MQVSVKPEKPTKEDAMRESMHLYWKGCPKGKKRKLRKQKRQTIRR